MRGFLTSLFVLTLVATPMVDCEANSDSIAAYVSSSSGDGFDLNYLDYDILLAAASKANLVGALANPDVELTLFAPNDWAFVLLACDLGYSGFSEAGAWDFLDQNVPTGLLTSVLLYHVVGEELSATDVLIAGIFRQPIFTLLGPSFQPSFLTLIDNDPDSPNAGLFFPINVSTGNGKVHTITRVLRPIDL